MASAFQANAFQVNAFQITVAAQQETAPPIAAGGWWASHRKVEDDWKRRKKQRQELRDIIRRASGELPDDVAEAQVVKQAADLIERAVDADEAVPALALPPPPDLGIESLRAAVQRAEMAVAAYKARKLAELRAIEEDDEDVLLLLS